MASPPETPEWRKQPGPECVGAIYSGKGKREKEERGQKWHAFALAGERLGYVTLQARKIRPIFFSLFPGERYCEIVQEQLPDSSHGRSSRLLSDKVNSQNPESGLITKKTESPAT